MLQVAMKSESAGVSIIAMMNTFTLCCVKMDWLSGIKIFQWCKLFWIELTPECLITSHDCCCTEEEILFFQVNIKEQPTSLFWHLIFGLGFKTKWLIALVNSRVCLKCFCIILFLTGSLVNPDMLRLPGNTKMQGCKSWDLKSQWEMVKLGKMVRDPTLTYTAGVLLARHCTDNNPTTDHTAQPPHHPSNYTLRIPNGPFVTLLSRCWCSWQSLLPILLTLIDWLIFPLKCLALGHMCRG